MSAMGESFSPFPRRPRAAGCILLAMVLMSCLALPEAAENGHEDSEMPSIAGLPVLRPAHSIGATKPPLISRIRDADPISDPNRVPGARVPPDRILRRSDIMNILVYGAGVLGSLYAARLRSAGHRVSLLARGRRLADLRRYGLALENAITGRARRCGRTSGPR
jgi:hypothetical protein